MTDIHPLVHLCVRMPPALFMEYLPAEAMISPAALVRRAVEVNAGLRRDSLGELWSLQHDVNSVLEAGTRRDLKLFYNEAKEAFGSGQHEMRKGRGEALGRADFVRSAVLFACAGERGVQLIRALGEAASAFLLDPVRPAAAAVMYEHSFRVSRRHADAASAASSWLQSINLDPDENSLCFRIARRERLLSLSASQP